MTFSQSSDSELAKNLLAKKDMFINNRKVQLIPVGRTGQRMQPKMREMTFKSECNLIVKNLCNKVTESELRQKFSKYGEIQSMRV